MVLGGLSYKTLVDINNSTECWSLFNSISRNVIENRVAFLQYAANNPIEDRYVFGSLKNIPGFVAAVLDGHGGW